MNTPQVIIIFGANGSGKTTIGRELARVLNYLTVRQIGARMQRI